MPTLPLKAFNASPFLPKNVPNSQHGILGLPGLVLICLSCLFSSALHSQAVLLVVSWEIHYFWPFLAYSFAHLGSFSPLWMPRVLAFHDNSLCIVRKCFHLQVFFLHILLRALFTIDSYYSLYLFKLCIGFLIQ